MKGLRESKNLIEYSALHAEHSAQGLPCLQRFSSSRWKLFLLLTVVVIQSVVIFTYASSRCVVKVESASVRHIVAEPSRNSNREEEKDLHAKHSRRRFPHFLVIGVKKSGTRALLNFLNMHPDIMTAKKEIHFFDRNDTYNKGMEWYRKQMPYTYPEQLTGEKSPGYYREAYVPERVHLMNSSIKLIVVVREPVERCMSNYLQHANGQSSFPSFESEVLLPNGEVNSRSPHVYNSDYNLFIDNWFDWFDRSQLAVVDGNLLVTDPHLVMQELQQFLGIRSYIDENFFQFDADKGFYCYYNHSTALKCLGESKGRKHPTMDPETKRKLYEYFAPRNRAFFSKIGKKFSWEIKQND